MHLHSRKPSDDTFQSTRILESPSLGNAALTMALTLTLASSCLSTDSMTICRASTDYSSRLHDEHPSGPNSLYGLESAFMSGDRYCICFHTLPRQGMTTWKNINHLEHGLNPTFSNIFTIVPIREVLKLIAGFHRSGTHGNITSNLT